MQSQGKRKVAWESGSPAPRSNAPGVKTERTDDVKRPRTDYKPTAAMVGAGPIRDNDPRTAALELQQQLKRMGTMNYHDAFIHIQDASPHVDVRKALEFLKAQKNIEFNQLNEVFTFVPDLTFTNVPALRTYIRTHSTPTQGVPVKVIREAIPPGGPISLTALDELEQKGDLMIMRGLTGQEFKDLPLPPLGKKNALGVGITGGRNERWKTIWWDDLKERGRTGKRLDQEMITAWDQVKIAETDDVSKLLAGQELSSSSVAEPTKPVAAAPVKKKKKATRALKITNTHMKDQGIDFSKDYERPT